MFTRAGFPLLFLLLVSSNRLGVMGNDQGIQIILFWKWAVYKIFKYN